MSIYSGKRIHFYGGYSTNVCTTNNNDIVTLIDPVNTVLKEPYLSQTDAEVQADLITPVKMDRHGDRNQRANVAPEASWNYYGDMTTIFENAKVGSYGEPGAVTEDTTLAGLPVYLLGSSKYSSPMMIDVDPTGTSGTQIFNGGIQIGDGDDAVIIRSNQCCYSYFLGPRFLGPDMPGGFPGIGAVWQCSFPKEAIPAEPTGNKDLDAFLADARAAEGIVLRYSIFSVKPGISNEDIIEQLKSGARPINPAMGFVIGTLGVWEAGELETSPSGRLLTSTSALNTASGTFDVVESNGDYYVSLNLANSLPKQSFRTDPTDISDIGPNVDLGGFHLEVNGVNVGEVPYDPQNYFKTGGMMDVKIDADVAEQLKSSQLIIVGDDDNDRGYKGLQLFLEHPYRIQSDQRCNYLDYNGSIQVSLRVLLYGQPVTQATKLSVNLSTSGKLPSPLNLTVNGEAPDVKGGYDTKLMLEAGQIDLNLTVAGKGDLGGLSLLNFSVDADPAKEAAPFYLNFRVYPNDDYSAIIASGDVDWDTVYKEVLRYYYLVFPAMSLRIPLNDPNTITVTASEFLKRLDPDLKSTTLYMPPTRDMSPGKVELLSAYLQKVQSKAPEKAQLA
ncbi:hypothetical protein Rhal01_02705 [Rubritalea halochordaticola]|uniref:Uncharacterized protein n=1 Tax=Rubritalea halochordaticola TaxID=714537 RepID=A0ABP9V5Z3_9BACT